MTHTSSVSRARAILEPLRGIGMRGLATAAAGLSGAAVAAQLIALAASPILLRLYSPEAFGAYLALTIVTSLGSTVVTWRFELAIQSPRSFRKAVALATAAAGAALATSLVFWFLFVQLEDEFGRSFRMNEAGSFSYFIPAMLLSTAAIEILRFVHWRKREFGVTAKAIVIAAASSTLLQFAFGIAGATKHGLLAGACIGQAVAALHLLVSARKYQLPFASLASVRTVVSVAREYKAFAFVTMPAGCAHMIAMQAPSAAIATLYGPAVGGLYYLASRLISAPVNVLSSAVYPTFVSAVVDIDRTRPAALSRLHSTSVVALLMLMSPLLVLFVVGPAFFAFVFGEQWRYAGHFAAWIALGEAVHLAATSTSALNVLRLNHLHAVWVVSSVLIVGAVITFVAWRSASPGEAVASISLSSAAMYGLLIALNALALARRQKT